MPSLPSLPGGTPAKSSTAAGGVTIAVGLIGAVGWLTHRFGPKPQPDAAKPVEGE